MITLLTGKPGTGKTAYAVKMLLEDKALQGRSIFTNIDGLKLPHHTIDSDWLRSWHKNTPPEAFILFDECQDVFVPRHTSKEPPDYVLELTKHRKDYSVDFFLITQRPTFIDFMVRGLCQRHIHIRETGFTRMIHESSEVVDFENKAEREIASGTPYKLPKQVFDLYQSAQVHTKKQRRRLPTAVYMFGAAALLATGIVWKVYNERFASDDSVTAASPNPAAGRPEGGGLPPLVAVSGPAGVPSSIAEATTPIDPANPLSAPLYAALAPPVVAPQIVGCIASRRACTCYSQQATPVWVPDPQCRDRAAGAYYDPYRQPMQFDSARTTQQTRAAESESRSEVPAGQASETPLPML